MAGIVFDITFTPGANAVGGFLEYRAVTPRTTLPNAPLQYPWEVALGVGNPITGYFPFTPGPMTLVNVPGNIPDFQPNTAYEFRIKQICPDGTEPYSDVDGTYWVPGCEPSTMSIEVIPIVDGPFGIGVTWVFPPGSSIQVYTVNLYDLQNNIIGTTTVQSAQMDMYNATPYTYIFTNSNTTAPLVPGISYSTDLIPSIQTENEPAPSNLVVVNNCPRAVIKAPLCSSYVIETGDQWGVEWYDCAGVLHNCYSNQPYTNNVIRLCSLGVPRTYYCDGAGFVDGFVLDGGGNITNGGRVTLAFDQVCNVGYSDFPNGLEYPSGQPVPCIANPTCGSSNKFIAGICIAPTDFDGTEFRNGDPIPYIDDPVAWSATTGPAWCWVNNQVGSPYGKLYNWYAVMDSRNIAPVGYHVPTAAEWAAWVQNMGYQGKSPLDLRIQGDIYWNNNLGATDYYNYSALGSGRRYVNGSTLNFKTSKWYWVDNSIAPAVSQWAYVIFTSNPPAGPGYAFHPATLPATTLDSLQGMSLRLFCD